MNASPGHYMPELDGLRAISITLVLIAHLGFEKIIPGGLGVTIFFFISGYLITGLLIDEHRDTGSISLRNFYVRRIIRLYPALIVLVILYSIVAPFINQHLDFREALAALFYYENYFLLYNQHIEAHLRMCWSLSVEEHFYLLFPLLTIIFVKNTKRYIAAIISLIVASLVIRCIATYIYGTGEWANDYTYISTLCRSDSILIGCLSAVLVKNGYIHSYLAKLNKWVLAIAVLTIVFTLVFRNSFFRQTIRYSLQSLALFVIIPAIVHKWHMNPVRKILSGSLIVWVGKISYGLYLFHRVAYAVTGYVFHKTGAMYYVSSFLLTFLLASACYYAIENKVSKLRRYFTFNHTNAILSKAEKI